MDLDEPFDGELLEGMADGGETDAELVAEFVSEESLAWQEVARKYGSAEGIVDFIGGALLAQWCQRHSDRLTKI